MCKQAKKKLIEQNEIGVYSPPAFVLARRQMTEVQRQKALDFLHAKKSSAAVQNILAGEEGVSWIS